VDDALRLFVDHPAALLSVLAATRSVVSGSLPLAVISGWRFVPRDLDIYVPESEERKLLSMLREAFGLLEVKFHVFNHRYDDCIAVKSSRWLTTGGGGRTVNVLTCVGESAILPVFHFHSTVVMNFISARGLYCAYPKLTTRRLAIPRFVRDMSVRKARALRICFAKYMSRGFKFYVDLDGVGKRGHVCGRDSSCPVTFRTLYDGAGLFVPREGGSVYSGERSRLDMLVYDERHSAAWMLGGSHCGSSAVCHDASACTLTIRVCGFRSIIAIDADDL
ncbi:hypothetical protein C8J57DRAFT_1100376, partial [Mycena rebaudengoi]